MIPTLSGCTLLATPLPDQLSAVADAGGTAVDIWLTQLEETVEKQSAEPLKKLLAERNLKLVSACYQGALLFSQGQERRGHFDHFQRRLSLCQEFGIETLAIVPDFAARVTAADLQRAQASLKQAAQLAAAFGVRLALEFRGDSSWCACVPTAAALTAGAAEANVGICFDAFHYYTGPSKAEDLALLTRDNLFLVQLCDLAGGLRELAGDAERILPGEGDFHLQPILDHLRRIGYAGAVTVELMNPAIWKMKPAQVAEAALTGLRRLLGLAKHVSQVRRS
jgi:2-keto-myo-inositol isomerase